MAQTLQERFAAGLIARGEHEIPSRSGKYRMFTRTKGGFYFLGSSGAVRVGACASKSLACGDKFKTLLLDLAAKPITSLEDLGL